MRPQTGACGWKQQQSDRGRISQKDREGRECMNMKEKKGSIRFELTRKDGAWLNWGAMLSETFVVTNF